jgi:Ca2+-binding EF-hand superfamily protein
MAGFLQKMDTNGDGRIDESEVDERRRPFVEMMARRAGIEPKFPISVNQLREGMARQASQTQNPPQNGTPNSPGTPQTPADQAKSPKTAPAVVRLVPGFGVASTLPPVPKFGVPVDPVSLRTTTAKPGAATSASPGGQADERIRGWAQGMLRQNDKNGNGKLERDEWGGMRGDPQAIDTNHDGVITLDELTAQLVAFSKNRGGPPQDSAHSEGSHSSESDSNDSSTRQSVRFLSAVERLPEGLPDWFKEKDANRDGQVAMAEYSTDWSTAERAQANVTEFSRYDLNRDGVITPDECLAAAEQQGAEAKDSKADDRRDGPSSGESRPEPPKEEKKGPSKQWSGW